MKSQERMKFWHQHVEAQKSSRVGVPSYCARERLSTYSFYQWRKRLAEFARTPVLAGRAFASVEVIGQPESSSAHAIGGRQLPDPKWTAIFVSQLLREFSA